MSAGLARGPASTRGRASGAARTRRLGVVVLLGLLVPALLPVPGAAAAAPRERAKGVVDRRLEDRRIPESSGLAVSTRHPGVLWTLNDSGNSPRLFAVGRNGRVAASLRVSGDRDAGNFDWEALAAFRDERGRSVLAVGDVGDNRRERRTVDVVLVPEPDRLADAEVTPERSFTLRYPDEREDAETLLVDPRTRRMLLVTKGLLSSTVYEVPAAVWPGGAATGTLRPVARLPLVLATDGVLAPDGHLIMRTYGSLALFAPLDGDRGGTRADGAGTDVPTLEPLASFKLPKQSQGEGITLAPGARAVLLSSEGVREAVLRVDLPPEVLRAAGGDLAADPANPAASPSPPPGRPAPGATPAPSSAASAVAARGGGQDAGSADGPATATGVVAAGAALAAGALLVAGLARRRARPRR